MTDPAVDEDEDSPGEEHEARRSTGTWTRAAVYSAAAVALLLIGATIGLLIGRAQDSTESAAAEPGAVDIGFCQDMTLHHRQAVEMGDLARLRGHSDDIKLLGYDISSTQNAQAGRMQGWLTLWDAPTQAPGELMTWMSPGHHHDLPPEPENGVPMPGMASADEMDKLRKLSGREFDVFFLQLMLRHHEGGVGMAEEAAENAKVPAVRALAKSMLVSQGSEVKTMRAMLDQLGAKPLN